MPSSVGTAPDASVLLSITNASIPGTEISCLLMKQVGAKCIEHKKDISVGAKFGRRFLTHFVHFCRVSGFFGNLCIDTPSVYEVLVHLTLLGSPATQYFPPLRVVVRITFCDSAIFLLVNIACKPHDVMERL